MGFHVTTQLQKAWDYLPIYSQIAKNSETLDVLNYDCMILSEILKKNEWQKYFEDFNNTNEITINQYEYLLKILSVELFLKMCQDT